MLHKITSLNTPEKPLYCEECGSFLAADPRFTKLNHDGPYCSKCIEEAQELEYDDNGQLGVGA
jgi:hypothetical protein